MKSLSDHAKWGTGLLRWLMGHRFQSSAKLKQREASERNFEARWNQELEKSERELEEWHANIKTAPIAEKLQAIEERFEAWLMARTSLDSIELSEEEKALKKFCLWNEYGVEGVQS